MIVVCFSTKVLNVYNGSIILEWKQRHYDHKQSFRNARHKNDTALSIYLWKLKNRTSEIRKLTWSILKVDVGTNFMRTNFF